jgi:long-chain acyl-CoA synthetase
MSIAAPTLAKAFERQALRFGTRAFLSTKADKQWRDYSWTDVADRAKRLRTGLIHLGIKTGDRVAILSENSPEWVIVDQALLGLGAIVVPLYTTSGAEEMRHVLNDSGARIVAVNCDRLIEKVQGLGGLDQLEGILAMHPGAVAQDDSGLEVITIEQLSAFEATRAIEGSADDLATFIYTSGTTGVPKGVMLSHGNLLANCESNLAALDMNEHELLLSFLPVAHSFERTAGYYTMMMSGGTIAYAEGLGTIAQNLLEIEPTLVLAVPRLIEMIYDKVNRTVEASSRTKRFLFQNAMKVGAQAAEYRHHGRRVPAPIELQMALYRRQVFAKIRAAFGGRMRYLIAGGAPLPEHLNRFFTAAEIPLVEGYGLTEAAPVVSCNLHGLTRIGSVGRALNGVEVRSAPDGELLVRGPNVMKGYYNCPDETNETIDSNGWLHTGDIGEVDAEGFIRITDRKKEIIVLSGGKNISPAKLENKLTADLFIAQACVIGDRRKHLAAIIVPNFASLAEEQQVKPLGLDGLEAEDLIRQPQLHKFFQDRIRELNRTLSDVEAIADFILIAAPFAEENGELTPTMKVRRKAVQEHYHDAIEDLYSGGHRAIPMPPPANPPPVPAAEAPFAAPVVEAASAAPIADADAARLDTSAEQPDLPNAGPSAEPVAAEVETPEAADENVGAHDHAEGPAHQNGFNGFASHLAEPEAVVRSTADAAPEMAVEEGASVGGAHEVLLEATQVVAASIGEKMSQEFRDEPAAPTPVIEAAAAALEPAPIAEEEGGAVIGYRQARRVVQEAPKEAPTEIRADAELPAEMESPGVIHADTEPRAVTETPAESYAEAEPPTPMAANEAAPVVAETVTIPQSVTIANPLEILARGLQQIAFVVKNLNSAQTFFGERMGVSRFFVIEDFGDRATEKTFRGRPTKHRFKIALGYSGNMQIELIEHVSGNTTYKEFLDRRGEGMHHLGYFIEDRAQYEDLYKEFATRHAIVQSGRFGETLYTYFDTEAAIGAIMELVYLDPEAKALMDRVKRGEF